MIFESILSKLLDKHASVIGIVFCAYDGEMVSMVSRDEERFKSYDLKVIAAYSSIWIRDVSEHLKVDAQTIRLSLATSKVNVLIHGLPGGYYLMVVAHLDALLGHVAHSLHHTAVETTQEM